MARTPLSTPHPAVRRALFVAGCLLVLVTPAIGVLPGPGGIFTFAAGMSLILRCSPWAKRRYVLLKRRWPRQGAWCDRGLRRPSARRRASRERAAKSD
ncbi:MAG: hypothetical protein ABW173_01560 [Sphingomonas sp.]